MGKLEGKVAIITGGSRGQGAAHVRKFVEEGAKVIFTDILEEEGEALAKELGENAKFVKHDVANAKDWDRVVNETEATFGPANVLVNNAALGTRKNIEDTSEEEYRKTIDINQTGTFLGMKAVAPSMKKVENGSIVNISSVEAFQVAADAPIAYSASKFAVRGMTKSAALEFAGHGIRVNSVHPGFMQTKMLENADPEDVNKLAETIPMKRMADPKEASQLVAFLASDESSYSTGTEFLVDGGLNASL
ncbi:glucose 1-dehydrogenase [Salicibibacter kimchii]|uniref:SDR family NAD(P)-dependent oxidoreductase n=1 Tax=Salicibibacter kimchii TaxID=2099786 RepID=A0A345BXC5_9BACI|nr:glucose 1-dehydrogenase [Salicibibacter kimchii]AXF55606.1 SDR family NAD(P)-dependent oxidoreductase [Salicibibacter kimchii]